VTLAGARATRHFFAPSSPSFLSFGGIIALQ
jgi:hypothetical protein